MKKGICYFLAVLVLALFAAPAAVAATYGTQVTVTSNNPEGGLVCATHATTSYLFISYTHKKPAAPTEAEYADTKTISWESSGGTSKCEVEFYLYAKPLPGYKFVRWEEKATQVSTAPEHTIKLNHSTKTPNHNPYSYTAIFEADNMISSQTVASTDGTVLNATAKIVLEPSAPKAGEEFTATAQLADMRLTGGNKYYPNRMVEFDHWEVNGVIVSTAETMSYTANEMIDLKAVYRTVAPAPQLGGYYRIRNIANRVLTLDGSYKVSISGAVDIDPSLLRLAKALDNDDALYPAPGANSAISDEYCPLNPEASPGTIFYIYGGNAIGADLDKAYIESQGAKSGDFISSALCITPMSDSFYGYYGMCASSAKSAGIKFITREIGDIINVSSFSNVDPFAAFSFEPIDEEHMDMFWFGADAAADMKHDGAWWSSMYTEFPYQCLDGVEAYYVKEVSEYKGQSIVLITKVEDGVVPAGSAVLLRCTEPENTKANRLLPLAPDTAVAPLEGNLLKGSCQLYTNKNREGRTLYNDDTMRVFGVNAKGEVGFYRLGGADVELTANRAYLDLSALPSGARAVAFKFSADTSGIEAVEAADEVVKFEDSTVYDLSGKRVSTPAAGKIYIIDGKKVLFR